MTAQTARRLHDVLWELHARVALASRKHVLANRGHMSPRDSYEAKAKAEFEPRG
jgi:hypothetical protein